MTLYSSYSRRILDATVAMYILEDMFPVTLSENRQVKIKLTDSMTPRSSEETPSHRFRGQSTKYFIIRLGTWALDYDPMAPWTNIA